MSERAEHWEYFQDLYRFAVVLTGDGDRAMRAVTASLDDALKRLRSHGEPDRLLALLFKDVRERVLRDEPARPSAGREVGGELPDGAEATLAEVDAEMVRAGILSLPEPGRSALALLYLEVMDAEEITRVLGVTAAELADSLAGTRARLHGTVARNATREAAE
jgi:DNA-directed RNA polymerase specialized sigma24 family protein